MKILEPTHYLVGGYLMMPLAKIHYQTL